MFLLKNKIVKNFSILTSTNLVIQLLSILSSIRLARQLQPVGYGMLNLVFLQSGIFAILAMYGLRFVIIRHIARNRQDAFKIFQVSNQIRLISTTLALLIAIGYNLLQSVQLVSHGALIALLVIIVFQSIWDSIESVAFGFEKMQASGYINLVFTVVWIIELYAIPNHLFTVSTLLFTYVINQVLKTILYYFWLRVNVLKLSNSYSFNGFNDHKLLLQQSHYYLMLAILALVINQLPILLLQFNSTVEQIGLFNLGNSLLSPLQMMLNMLLTALFPMLARLSIDNQQLFAKRIKILLNIIIIAGIWGCLCFALFSDDVVSILYGAAYATSAKIIVIQCWFTVLFAISSTIGTVLNAYDKQKRLTQISLIYAIISAPIFYYGTKHGAIGLAWAFVIAAFINMSYQWIIFRKLLNNQISYLYALLAFSIIGILSLVTNLFKIDWALPYRLVLVIFLSLFFFLYLYKVEYVKIKTN
jgi:O-antigen/teichoic acid export membrane protein